MKTLTNTLATILAAAIQTLLLALLLWLIACIGNLDIVTFYGILGQTDLPQDGIFLVMSRMILAIFFVCRIFYLCSVGKTS